MSLTLQGAPKDGFGEIVMACGMPKPRKFPSLYSCQMRFLWTHKEVDLALHIVAGPVDRNEIKDKLTAVVQSI